MIESQEITPNSVFAVAKRKFLFEGALVSPSGYISITLDKLLSKVKV